jgi:hypothetical protein
MNRWVGSICLISAGLALCLPRSAAPGATYGPGVGLHIAPVQGSNACASSGLINIITDAVVETQTLSTPGGPFYFVYLVGCDHEGSPGIATIECGIGYQGGHVPLGGARPICVFNWTLCADIQFPYSAWPGPGGGNLIGWTCGSTPPPGFAVIFEIAGFFYMGAYEPSRMMVIPNPVSGLVQVTNCGGTVLDVTVPPDFAFFQGTAGFATHGWPPCLGIPLPVEPTTWGRLKAFYAD